MKPKTSRQNRDRKLRVNVMSPRIAWLSLLRLLGVLAKATCVVLLLAAACWGLWRGARQAFYQNPDFRLQVIDLNPNAVIDEAGVADLAGIDLADCPSLFSIDAAAAAGKLKALPGIAGARVERHLPGTLVVRVEPRAPVAWIRREAGSPGDVANAAGGLLVDASGFAYPCPPRQSDAAAALPVILLTDCPEHPLEAGGTIHHPALGHCLRLLECARAADPESVRWIESIRQANDWSLELVTRHRTVATFSLGDHARQIENLRAALDHAGARGYVIETINLMPKHNIPITVRDEPQPPRAILVTPRKEAAAEMAGPDDRLGAAHTRD